jgi:hypothetical protein
MQSKKILLEQFALGLQQGKTNTVLLAELLNMQYFEAVAAKDATVTSSKRDGPNSIQLVINGHMRSVLTKVYRVKHLGHYINHANGTLVRREYVGKTFLIYTKSVNCAKAVDETSQPVIDDACLERNFSDPALKLWRETPIPGKPVVHSKYIAAGPKFIIYCWTNKITI